MKRLFVDTSALIALKDAGDAHHWRALEYFEVALADPASEFFVTNFILAEVHGYFCRSPEIALRYIEELASHPSFRVVRAGKRDEARALEILRSSRDKTYSYVDAVSFAVMERLRVKAVFSFDKHFRQFGRHQSLP